jgi:hypothetical protein
MIKMGVIAVFPCGIRLAAMRFTTQSKGDTAMAQPERTFQAIMLERNPALREATAGSDLSKSLSAGLKKRTIDEVDYYVVEGDLLLDEDQLAIYAFQRELGGEVGIEARGLVGITQGGKIVRWQDGLVLTYCVLQQTFSNGNQYQIVRDNMLQATGEWEATCGVKFQHRAELDNSDSLRPDGVLFTVRGIDAGGAFIAAAFFPNDPPSRRRVLIDPSYFASDLRFNKVGVLRHELGHVLGFRHEHIRSGAPPACPDEPVWGTINLTDYDPQSTMHYFCGGVGSTQLAITELDKAGAQKVYGLPLSAFILMA